MLVYQRVIMFIPLVFLPWESNHNQLFILVWTIKNWQCFMERYCKLITSNCTAKLSILSFDVEAKFEKVPVEWTCEQWTAHCHVSSNFETEFHLKGWNQFQRSHFALHHRHCCHRWAARFLSPIVARQPPRLDTTCRDRFGTISGSTLGR